MRLLGIDYGDKKIGLAFGDDTARVAVPLDVIKNDGPATLQALQNRLAAERIAKVVIGVPLQTNQQHSPEQLEKTRAFIQNLRDLTNLPIFEEDESFTTAESLRLQREEGAEAEDDALAAMLILQAYMDRQN